MYALSKNPSKIHVTHTCNRRKDNPTVSNENRNTWWKQRRKRTQERKNSFILYSETRHINKNITPESKENQHRPLQQMKCCATIAAIFIVKTQNKILPAIGNPFCDSKYTESFFPRLTRYSGSIKTFRSKVVGELVPTKISDAPVTQMNADKGCKTIYYKGRKGKKHLQKSSFPKIL